MNVDAWIEAALANPLLAEENFQKFQKNPNSIDSSWFFAFSNLDQEKKTATLSPVCEELRIHHLIEAYRKYGHLMAQVNPIAVELPKEPEQLKLETLGFKVDDLRLQFPTLGILPSSTATLEEIIQKLKSIYCDKVGIEYKGLENSELETWIQKRIEPNGFRSELTIDQKKMILYHLNRSELLESFIHTKYTAQKRFSIEGEETLIPMLEEVVEVGSQEGVGEFIIGMAHRGRLNVLSNILRKSHSEIFSEFEEGYIPNSFEGSGDVKYHKGFFSEVTTPQGKKVKISLLPNPSHLESVDPVVEGQTCAKQIMIDDRQQERVMPILVHGDAAVAGQGIVYETLQLCHIPGYSTGGTLHFVINNQIGFTATPGESRSTWYCTDIAKAFSAPVFHVNAEDPESCVYVTNLATEIRQKFHCDVFIDLNGYRKYGHNESDEPAYTQPLEYQIIRKKSPIREIYRDQLIHEGTLERDLAENLEKEFVQKLNEALQEAKKGSPNSKKVDKREKTSTDLFPKIKTGVPKKILLAVAEKISAQHEGFHIHPKLKNLVQERLSMVIPEAKPIDWGMAELLAYGSILWEGYDVRISGQDCRRGTFSHRHAVWMDQEVEQVYIPLSHLKEDQGRFDILNSPLSEFAILGFEFGYSVAMPTALVIWEAQFGDFSNGAQVMIDQFIATSEQKWGQKFSLTLFLPHGYEGQGPEHSSGRMERFLSLAGEDNMRIVNPTTPAQFFHLLRKQVLNPVKKPLIVFTPKGLLRHPECVSTLKDLSEGTFQLIIDDNLIKPNAVKRFVLCSGRIYYDLLAECKKREVKDMVIIRLEQLYPLNIEELKTLISKYGKSKEWIWIQEEPSNMGAWDYLRPILRTLVPNNQEFKYIGRPRSASPAVGSYALHKKQFGEMMNALFDKERQ